MGRATIEEDFADCWYRVGLRGPNKTLPAQATFGKAWVTDSGGHPRERGLGRTSRIRESVEVRVPSMGSRCHARMSVAKGYTTTPWGSIDRTTGVSLGPRSKTIAEQSPRLAWSWSAERMRGSSGTRLTASQVGRCEQEGRTEQR